ncbi:hypothetical protein IJ556_06880 [bacterium]|nr:hypothetical protein [bacterium]
MHINEKEFNGNLFDQLAIVELLDRAYKKEEYEQESALIKEEIKRKLYQQPPLTEQ